MKTIRILLTAALVLTFLSCNKEESTTEVIYSRSTEGIYTPEHKISKIYVLDSFWANGNCHVQEEQLREEWLWEGGKLRTILYHTNGSNPVTYSYTYNYNDEDRICRIDIVKKTDSSTVLFDYEDGLLVHWCWSKPGDTAYDAIIEHQDGKLSRFVLRARGSSIDFPSGNYTIIPEWTDGNATYVTAFQEKDGTTTRTTLTLTYDDQPNPKKGLYRFASSLYGLNLGNLSDNNMLSYKKKEGTTILNRHTNTPDFDDQGRLIKITSNYGKQSNSSIEKETIVTRYEYLD